ncbi:unnamed protein product [Lampetra fluviatilis]
MDTRKTTRTHERGRDDDGVPGTPTSGGEDEEWPPMQHLAVMADALLASDTSLQDAHSRLAELLLAAAAILAEISVPAGGKTAAGLEEGARLAGSRQKALRAKSLEVPAVFEGPPLIGGKHGRHVAGHLRAAQPTSSARAGALHFAPDNRADILDNYSGARENLSDVDDDRVLQQRLPALSAFKADGGDWGAFQRRFLAHQEMSGWSDTTALRALPAMLDDDALAAFTSAARSSRSTLQAALHLMAKVFGPPSTCRHQFYDRRKVAGETTLAYRTALLALADAAFPRMDKEGKDAMVTEQLLVLAHELGVPINVADEMDICSLAIATSIHAYEVLKRRPGVVCNLAGNAVLAATIAEPQPAAVQEQAFAASRPGEWRTGGRSPTRSPRKLEQPKPTTSVVCYNCGLRGHVAAGCRAPRQRATGPRRDDDQGHKSSQQNPASRGTSHVRSTNTAHSGRRFAALMSAGAAFRQQERRFGGNSAPTRRRNVGSGALAGTAPRRAAEMAGPPRGPHARASAASPCSDDGVLSPRLRRSVPDGGEAAVRCQSRRSTCSAISLSLSPGLPSPGLSEG